MRKELKITKTKNKSLLFSFGISDKRRAQLAEFTEELIEKNLDTGRGKTEVIAGIWNNKKFTDNEAAFMLFGVGGFIERMETKSDTTSLAGLILKLQ